MKSPALLLLLGLSFLGDAVAQEAPQPDPDLATLRESSAYLAALPAWSAEVTMHLELADKSGRTQTGDLTGVLDLAGLDRLRFKINAPDGVMEMVYGPDQKIIFLHEQNQYLKSIPFGDRRKALSLMPSQAFTPAQILLSDFLHAHPALFEGVESADTVGEDQADAPRQIRISGDGIVTDFWIRRGAQPVLEKFSMDLLKMLIPSNPDLTKAVVTYTFTKWSTEPNFAADHFAMTLPEGAKELDPRADEPKDPLLGKAAPEFKLPLLDSGTMELAAHKGKDVVILDFWASWCGPCRQGLPVVSEVASQFKDKNVVFYAVNVGESADIASAFLKQTGLSLPVALDTDRSVQRQYGAGSIPKTVIVNKEGVVHEVHLGVSPYLREELTETLTELTK